MLCLIKYKFEIRVLVFFYVNFRMRFPCESVFCDSSLSDARKKLSELTVFESENRRYVRNGEVFLHRWLLENMPSVNLKKNFALEKNRIKT